MTMMHHSSIHYDDSFAAELGTRKEWERKLRKGKR